MWFKSSLLHTPYSRLAQSLKTDRRRLPGVDIVWITKVEQNDYYYLIEKAGGLTHDLHQLRVQFA
jgi:hypothetical protein